MRITHPGCPHALRRPAAYAQSSVDVAAADCLFCAVRRSEQSAADGSRHTAEARSTRRTHEGSLHEQPPGARSPCHRTVNGRGPAAQARRRQPSAVRRPCASRLRGMRGGRFLFNSLRIRLGSAAACPFHIPLPPHGARVDGNNTKYAKHLPSRGSELRVLRVLAVGASRRDQPAAVRRSAARACIPQPEAGALNSYVESWELEFGVGKLPPANACAAATTAGTSGPRRSACRSSRAARRVR